MDHVSTSTMERRYLKLVMDILHLVLNAFVQWPRVAQCVMFPFRKSVKELGLLIAVESKILLSPESVRNKGMKKVDCRSSRSRRSDDV
jgi:hypothetical protein